MIVANEPEPNCTTTKKNKQNKHNKHTIQKAKQNKQSSYHKCNHQTIPYLIKAKSKIAKEQKTPNKKKSKHNAT